MPITFADARDFLRDLKDGVVKDRVVAVAAGVTFYGLLALVPAVTALISVYGLVTSPAEVPLQLAPVTGMMPPEAATLLIEQAERIAGKAGSTLSLTAVVALLIALWSANGGTRAMIEALGIAYDAKETRGFVRLNLVSLGFTLGALGAVIVLGLAAAALPFAVDRLGGTAETLILILRWPVIFALLLAGLAVLYRWAPDRPDADLVWISPGAVMAALGLILTSAGLGWYVGNFGSYDETYGSLAAVVVTMLWVWLSTVVVLIGAEINARLGQRKGGTAGLRVPLVR